MKKLSILLILPLVLLAQPKARVQRTVVCTGAGSATAATCTPSPALSALSDLSTTPRTLVSFTPTASNTGALTLAINGLTATAVVKYVGGAAQALAANDLRSGTSYMLEYDGSAFVVKSVLGNGGGGGGGSGDVVGPASAADNEVAIYDSTTGKLIKRGTGCTIASSKLTCTGGFSSGDGTTLSGTIYPELAVNGTNDFRIYGAGNQSADGCMVFAGPLASGDAWRGSASTVTDSDSKTCRVMETYTPAAGGPTSTSGLCGLATACAIPSHSMASAAWGAVANRVYTVQFVMPYTKTISTLGGFSSGGGGTVSDGMAFGIYENATNAATNLLAGCAFVDVTAGSVMKTCAASITLTGGTTYWLAATVQNTAMTMRVLDTMFAQMLTSVPSSSRAGYCANVSSGTGTGLTLPPTCGGVTLAAFQMPFVYGY